MAVTSPLPAPQIASASATNDAFEGAQMMPSAIPNRPRDPLVGITEYPADSITEIPQF